MDRPCRIELLGGLRVLRDQRVITRFNTQKTAGLLAYLAYHSHRLHPREFLVELLWPESDPHAGRASLNMAVSSLRRQLEPPGIPGGAILKSDRFSLGVNPAGVITDLSQWRKLVKSADQAVSIAEQARLLRQAVELYRGILLFGFYEEWVQAEQARWADVYFHTAHRLIQLLMHLEDFEAALDISRQVVNHDPLREEAHCQLMELYVAAGEPAAALRQFSELERILGEELEEKPTSQATVLAARIRAGQPLPTGRLPQERGKVQTPLPQEQSSYDRQTQEESPSSLHGVHTPRLPIQFTRFFGREKEIEKLLGLIKDESSVTETVPPSASRLITLTGPGGTGKTRLAIEFAGQVVGEFPRGVWFAPLADLLDARLVAGVILKALGLQPASMADALDQITCFLNDSGGETTTRELVVDRSLLILDNFEQLVDQGAGIVLSLLARCPGLTCVVTSRRRLALPGERELPIDPLPIPGDSVEMWECGRTEVTATSTLPNSNTPTQLLEFPSVQLFVDRAQSARPDFQITDRNASAVASLCARLEGIPLALELAAARSQMLTPAQMLTRLEERFELLSTRRTDKSSRHRSVWAAIGWSYDLLPLSLRRQFSPLAVFRGTFDANAAHHITMGLANSDSDVSESLGATLYSLTQLRECSMLQLEAGDDDLRYRMIDSIREFAQQQLSDRELDALEHCHFDYFASLAEKAGKRLTSSDQTEWLQRLESDHDNLRAALRRRLDQGDHGGAARLGAALWRFWWIRGHADEGRRWLSEALADAPRIEPAIRAEALHGAGTLAWARNDASAAKELHGSALEVRRASGDKAGMARSLGSLGNVCREAGETEDAQRYYEESLELFRAIDDRWGVATSYLNLGTVAEDRHDLQRAGSYYQASLTAYQELGDRHGASLALGNIADVECNQGNLSRASELLRESLAIRRDLGDKTDIAYLLYPLAKLALSGGNPARAITVLSAAEHLFDELRVTRSASVIAAANAVLETARSQLNQPEFDEAWAAGSSLSFDQALDLAFG